MPSILFGALLTLAVAWMLGNLCLRRLPVPWTINFAIGAAVESTLVFLLLATGIGSRQAFLALAVACLAAFWWKGRGAARLADPLQAPPDAITRYLAGAVLAFYGVLYFINALAPELEPDAVAYHLGLTAEYVRLHGFPDRVGFYEMLPQGLEMLFVPAFAFGRHSAARLVHCAFLLATVPLILQIARRLALPGAAALAAAILYFCAPVTGITGTSAYTDAGGVFFTLAAFYLLLAWRDTRDVRYLAVAGFAAGFCYAIKIPGALVPVLAVLFVVAADRRVRVRPLVTLAGAALAAASPWIVRDIVMTGSPLAPLFNRLFPTPFFHLAMEQDLAVSLRSWGGIPAWRVPYQLAMGGAFAGILGPVFLALPLALAAVRKRAGRLCWLAAALLALPWFWNTGTRFLMPALPFMALALAMSLPRPALWAAIAVQAIVCWPQIFPLFHREYVWRLERIPWRAALRIQPESDYVGSLIPGYGVARLVQDNTQPGERTFSLISLSNTYTDREVLEFWHSAEADNLSDALRLALSPSRTIFDIKAAWTPRPLSGFRLRMTRPSPVQWEIHDIKLYSGARQVPGSPQWQLSAWPNVWDLPLAFDDNRATRWLSLEPIRAGMFVETDFDPPLSLTSALVTSPFAFDALPFEFYGRQPDGWHLLTPRPAVTGYSLGDVRRDATRAIRDAGYRYILGYNGGGGNGEIGSAMLEHPHEWNVEKIAGLGPVLLFRID